jgi:hypothetical protein
MASIPDFNRVGMSFGKLINIEADMDRNESPTSNSRPDSGEDDDRIAGAARRAAECCRAVAEAWRASVGAGREG